VKIALASAQWLALLAFIALTSSLHAIAQTRPAVEAEATGQQILSDATSLIQKLLASQDSTDNERKLIVECAILSYPQNEDLTSSFTAGGNTDFLGSLALGGMAARELKTNPARAQELLMKAQRSAMEFRSWFGKDESSLPYLFELITLFEQPRASEVLALSTDSLIRWRDGPGKRSRSMLVLAKAVLTLEPERADQFLHRIVEDRLANHLTDSYDAAQRLLGRYVARHDPETARKASAFYESNKDWIRADGPMRALLLEDATRDIALAIQRMGTLEGVAQPLALIHLAVALAEDGKYREAEPVLKRLEELVAAGGQIGAFAASSLPNVKWQAQAPAAPSPVSPEDIDQILNGNNVQAAMQRSAFRFGIVFRDRKQAEAFIAAATPQAETIFDLGYPHHGSPRSEALALIAIIHAHLGDLAAAKAVSEKIQIDELRAACLLETYRVGHPLPAVTDTWPIYLAKAPPIQIGVDR
jgi:hypothetical protein